MGTLCGSDTCQVDDSAVGLSSALVSIVCNLTQAISLWSQLLSTSVPLSYLCSLCVFVICQGTQSRRPSATNAFHFCIRCDVERLLVCVEVFDRSLALDVLMSHFRNPKMQSAFGILTSKATIRMYFAKPISRPILSCLDMIGASSHFVAPISE